MGGTFFYFGHSTSHTFSLHLLTGDLNSSLLWILPISWILVLFPAVGGGYACSMLFFY